ncbi:unnamed protein product [Caenorhabditis brenneri]
MAAWSCLPPEIKLHVIRNLDFMSRKSLRCVSYSDRDIVDSTIFTLPRVRFGYKKGRCLIVIYTGIEKFLRWEMEMGDGFINYHRSQNTFDPEFFVKKQLKDVPSERPNAFMLVIALYYLTELVAHKSIQIKTMEWELSSDGLSNDEKELVAFIINTFVTTSEFRVEELVFPERNHGPFVRIVMENAYILGLKSFRRLGIIISAENLVPEVAHESGKTLDDGVSSYRTTLLMKDTLPTQLALMHRNFEILKTYYEKDCPSKATYCSVYNKYEDEKVKRKVENDGYVTYITETKCGCTVLKTHSTHEKDYIEEVDIKKCVLGDLCKRCADPFEHWYTQNLPRRFHYEPFWNGIIEQSPVMGRDEGLQMVLLKVKLEKYEKEKARIQKIVDLKRGKVGGGPEGRQWSWGFDKKKGQGLGFGAKVDTVTKSFPEVSTVTQEATVIEKPTATQFLTVTEKVKEPAVTEKDTVTQLPTVTEEDEVTPEDPVSEDAKEPTEEFKEPLMIQEFTAILEATETIQTPSLLKYLLVLIVVPIALAIIFAFF